MSSGLEVLARLPSRPQGSAERDPEGDPHRTVGKSKEDGTDSGANGDSCTNGGSRVLLVGWFFTHEANVAEEKLACRAQERGFARFCDSGGWPFLKLGLVRTIVLG